MCAVLVIQMLSYVWFFVPTKAIVDELSEPIKYQSAVDKRAAQMVVFGIDEVTFSLLVQVLSAVAATSNGQMITTFNPEELLASNFF